MGPESWRWTGLQVGGGGEPDMYRMKQHTLRIMSATYHLHTVTKLTFKFTKASSWTS